MEDQAKVVATSIRNKLGSLPSFPIKNHCIYKVPHHIRKENEECYQPSLVSIGPIYYGDPNLQAMQELKLMHLQCLLEQENDAYSMEHYVKALHEWEKEARSYYVEKINLSSDEFVEMMLVDAAFIIILFMWSNSQLLLENHPLEKKAQVLLYLEKDLVVLEENQLPFFILKGVYDIAFGATYPNTSFLDVTSVFLSISWFRESGPSESEVQRQMLSAPKINHLVDFVRICYLPSKLREQLQVPNNSIQLDPQFPLTVTELSAVGVKFMPWKGKMLDISFENGILKIPKLIIRDASESVGRNMVFYEQCHHFYDSYFVDYIRFLDKLIKTPRDVEILVRNGIIHNWLGSDEEVANVIHRIAKKVILNFPNFYYYGVSRDLNAHATTSWNRCKTILRRDYFSHPWASISVIYAVILLILTLLQTISSFTSNT